MASCSHAFNSTGCVTCANEREARREETKRKKREFVENRRYRSIMREQPDLELDDMWDVE